MSRLDELRGLYQDITGWKGEELDPVDFVCASYVSTFLPGSVQRSWGDLTGGASTGKGEVLAMTEEYPRTILMHNLTENAFSSAYRDPDKPADPSLLGQLSQDANPKGPKVLILPELTNFLSKHRDSVTKFFGQTLTSHTAPFQYSPPNC